MKPKLADGFVVLGVLLLAALCWRFSFSTDAGDYALVTVGGKPYAKVSLQRDTSLCVEECLTVTVKGGAVSVCEARCLDKLCEKHRPICKAGESIICLPNKVQIEIISENEAPYDAVAR